MHLAISLIWWSVSGSLKMRAKMRRSFQCQMAPEVLTVFKMKTTPNTSLYLIVLQPNPTFSQLLWWQLVTVLACCYLFSFWLFHQRSVKPRNGVYAAAYADLFLFHMMAIVIAVPWYITMIGSHGQNSGHCEALSWQNLLCHGVHKQCPGEQGLPISLRECCWCQTDEPGNRQCHGYVLQKMYVVSWFSQCYLWSELVLSVSWTVHYIITKILYTYFTFGLTTAPVWWVLNKQLATENLEL